MVTKLSREQLFLFFKSLTSDELEISYSDAAPYRYTWYYRQNGSADGHILFQNVYNFNASRPAKAGYRFLNIAVGQFSTDSFQNYHSSAVRSLPADAPFDDVGHSHALGFISASQLGAAIWVPDSISEANYIAWINKVARDPSNLYNTDNWLFNKDYPVQYKRWDRRYTYLNDLMQHKQPFGPTSSRRSRL